MGILGYTFKNINFNSGGLTLPIVIWGMYAGMIIALLISVYNRVYIGNLVRRLIGIGASTPETAVTLDRLGIRLIFRKNELKDGKPLRKLVACANEEDYPYPNSRGFRAGLRRFFSSRPNGKRKLDLRTARFYIPEENRIRAELRYEAKGMNAWMVIGAIVLITGAFVALYLSLPALLELLDGVIGTYYSGKA